MMANLLTDGYLNTAYFKALGIAEESPERSVGFF